MRVALFAAGGEIPRRALRALHGAAEVVAIVRARPGGLIGAVRSFVRGPDTLSQEARALGIPVWPMRGREDPLIAERLRATKVDLSCIATFPWPLGESVLAAARLATINVHSSLLPRHRGPNPLFWTYHSDDREAGVTVHLASAAVDAGPILAQARWPLARGRSILSLHSQIAEQGAALLPPILARWEAGDPDAQAQDSRGATSAPRVTPGQRMLDPGWPAERTWHFLRGLVGQHVEPLICDRTSVPYRAVTGFECGQFSGEPGDVVRARDNRGWVLRCIDGAVFLAGAAD